MTAETADSSERQHTSPGRQPQPGSCKLSVSSSLQTGWLTNRSKLFFLWPQISATKTKSVLYMKFNCIWEQNQLTQDLNSMDGLRSPDLDQVQHRFVEHGCGGQWNTIWNALAVQSRTQCSFCQRTLESTESATKEPLYTNYCSIEVSGTILALDPVSDKETWTPREIHRRDGQCPPRPWQQRIPTDKALKRTELDQVEEEIEQERCKPSGPCIVYSC